VDDPERFERLVAYRRKQLIWPIMMILGGILGVTLILI
jgi:hypothetical protein